MTTTTVPDLAAVKARQRQAWASGDYSAVAATVPLISERLVDAADLRAGWLVLDVAGGSGNASLAAARSGCDVICTDYVPDLLERAATRGVAEGLGITVREADAEALPFPDDSFDAVISAIGVMFTPDQPRAAAELVRVCRPGGTIALASWTPDSFVAGMFRMISAHVPPPAGLRPATDWGDPRSLERLLGQAVERVVHERHVHSFRFRSPEDMVGFFRDNYGPVHRAFLAMDEDGRRAMNDDFVDLIRRHDRLGGEGAVAVPATYLVSVARMGG